MPDCRRKDHFEKVLLGLGQSTELEVLIRASKARSIPVGERGWHENGWKEAQPQSNVEGIDEIGRSGRTDIVSWPCVLGMHSTWMQVERNYYWGIQKMFESQISADATKKLLGWEEIPREHQALGVMMWKVMRRNAWNDIANWRTKRLSSCMKSLHHVLMTIKSKRKSWKLWENCQKSALQFSWSTNIWCEFGRPDILWSVNKLARADTKWTRACDKRWARLISYLHHTRDHRQYCHVENAEQHCRIGVFQDSDIAGDLEDSKSTSGREFCVS